jgi:hypothetical protein
VLPSGVLPNCHPAVISHYLRVICSCACRVCLAIFGMADIHEQHIDIKFCFKVRKIFKETHEMMKNVYDKQCMSCTCCYVQSVSRFC